MPAWSGSATRCSRRRSSAATSWWRSAAAWSAISRASPRRWCAGACASCRCRPPCSPRSIPPSAARPASIRATARTSSAPSTSRAWCSPTPRSSTRCPLREMRAGYAEVVKYGLIDDARLLRLVRGELAGHLRRRAGARRGRGAELPRQGRCGGARRARGRRPRAAQSRPHLRPCARAHHRLRFRPPRPWRGRRHRPRPRLPLLRLPRALRRRRTPSGSRRI